MQFRKEWKAVAVWEWEEGGWGDKWMLRKEERENFIKKESWYCQEACPPDDCRGACLFRRAQVSPMVVLDDEASHRAHK